VQGNYLGEDINRANRVVGRLIVIRKAKLGIMIVNSKEYNGDEAIRTI
jgi:hypothetical protein